MEKIKINKDLQSIITLHAGSVGSASPRAVLSPGLCEPAFLVGSAELVKNLQPWTAAHPLPLECSD